MAQPIQVPQTTPNAPQFQVPTDLVNAYLDRKQKEQHYDIAQMQGIGETALSLHQQKIQNQLAALGARVQATRLLGPQMANQIYAGQNPNPTQQSIPPQGTPQNATLPISQDQAPSPYIQASLAAGHPDVAGHSTFHASQDIPNQVGDLATQMPQYMNQGELGKEKIQELLSQQQGLEAQGTAQKTQNDIAMNPLNVAEKQANVRAANSKFATPEQGAAIASGDPSAVAGAYGGQAPVEAYNNAATKTMEKNKAAASEISKQGPLTTEVKTLQGMFDNVDKNLHDYYSEKHMVGSANAYRLTKGRVGSEAGATVLNQSAPLVAAINKSLTARFNMGENELLSGTIAPSPNDTPQYAASKMRLMHQLISAMDSGNKENVSNVIAAMNGNVPSQVKANGR